MGLDSLGLKRTVSTDICPNKLPCLKQQGITCHSGTDCAGYRTELKPNTGSQSGMTQRRERRGILAWLRNKIIGVIEFPVHLFEIVHCHFFLPGT